MELLDFLEETTSELQSTGIVEKLDAVFGESLGLSFLFVDADGNKVTASDACIHKTIQASSETIEEIRSGKNYILSDMGGQRYLLSVGVTIGARVAGILECGIDLQSSKISAAGIKTADAVDKLIAHPVVGYISLCSDMFERDKKINMLDTQSRHSENSIDVLREQSYEILNENIKQHEELEKVNDQLRQKKGELEDYGRNLETKVEERTVELAGINEQLQKNLTNLKLSDEQLKRAKEEAETANAAKSQFLSSMSHEIRTPLNGIIGMAELALDTDLDDDQLEIFNTINEESISLLSVINDILDFSKIEAEKIELEEVPFDLRTMMENVINSFFLRVSQRGLELFLFLPSDLPTKIIGDPSKLRQILVNLIGNALKFTHQGEIYVKAEKAEDLGDIIKVHFSVKDTGIGIPKDRQAQIFESFTQADDSTTRKYGGTGLGTTISKKFVEMMGGKIGVESEQGKGSTFWFTVPFVKQTGQQIIHANKDIDLRGLNVLVADDNQTNRYILMEYLRSWGCRPVEASGGEEALSLLSGFASSKEPFDMVLTGLMKPGMDSFELAEKIRSEKDLKELPIIVFTSAENKGDGNRCRALEINGYLTKPIRRDNLHRTIKSVVGIFTEPEKHLPQELITQHTTAEEYKKDVCILLAEDYPTNQKVVLRHLQTAGYQADLAENGRQAVEAFKQKHYDLILMDIQMPEMDGYEATKQIRYLESKNSAIEEGNNSDIKTQDTDKSAIRSPQSATRRVPIIAMTAHAIKGYKEYCIEIGMDDYITKPMRKKKLLEIIEKWSGGLDA